jgi:hypothetical protein
MVQYMKSLFALVDKYGAGTIGIKAISDLLRSAFQQMVMVLDYMFGSVLTKQIHSQDRYREGILHALSIAARASLFHLDPAVRDAADRVSAIITHYGNIPKRGYEEESAAIDDLLRELQSAETAPLVTLMSLGGLVALLAASNGKFFELVEGRDAEALQRPKITMKEARAEVERLLEEMLYRLEGINAMNLAEGDDFPNFVVEYNALATRHKLLLAQEKGRKKAANEEDATEDEENEEAVEEQ